MIPPGVDATHAPDLSCWVPGADTHAEFPIQNLPLGVFTPPAGGAARVGVAIGDHVLDAAAVASAAGVADLADDLAAPSLNALFARGAPDRRRLRAALSALLSGAAGRGVVEPALHPAAACALHLPCRVGDYTDFYVGVNHATNIGRLFRPDAPLLPNYKWVPIGYHGRASSVRVSGAEVVRPHGQTKAPDAAAPAYGPTRRLDFELEMAVWIGAPSALGRPVPIARAADHVAGFGLLNDWSARDVQAWEYQPLGPFLAKNFLTTVSPWVVTVEAMAPFRIAQPPRLQGDPEPLPHLDDPRDRSFGALSVELETTLATAAMRARGEAPVRLGCGPASNMYWTVAQMVAHHTSGGCDLNAGDLLGTGTISTPDDAGLGSLIELTRGGGRPLQLPGGETRAFLEDGDEVTLRARAHAEGFRSIGFGRCTGRVAPALDLERG